jgi:hypothetical protein
MHAHIRDTTNCSDIFYLFLFYCSVMGNVQRQSVIIIIVTIIYNYDEQIQTHKGRRKKIRHWRAWFLYFCHPPLTLILLLLLLYFFCITSQHKQRQKRQTTMQVEASAAQPKWILRDARPVVLLLCYVYVSWCAWWMSFLFLCTSSTPNTHVLGVL